MPLASLSPSASAAIAIAAAHALVTRTAANDPPPPYNMAWSPNPQRPVLPIQQLGNEPGRMIQNYYPHWTEDGVPVGGPRLEIHPVGAVPPAVLRQLEAKISPRAAVSIEEPKQLQAPKPSAPPDSGADTTTAAREVAGAERALKRLSKRDEQKSLDLLKKERALEEQLRSVKEDLRQLQARQRT